MKKTIFFLFLLFALFFSGCQSKEHQLIKNYELAINQIQVIKIYSTHSYVPFYARDSVKILESVYDSVFKCKIESVKNQQFDIEAKIEKTEKELETVKNELMVAAIENRIKLMKENLKSIEKILLIYQNTPQKTQLNHLIEKTLFYTQMTDSLLGYTLNVSFLGQLGKLDKQLFIRTYLFDSNKSQIIGIIQKQTQTKIPHK